MVRPFYAFCLLAALTSGCVVMPTGASAGYAGVERLQLTVPTPVTATSQTIANTIPWNRARLTIAPSGSTLATQHLLNVDDYGLQMHDALDKLPPGRYDIHIDLLEDMADGSQRVIGAGDLTGASAATLHAGANDVIIPIKPAVAGTYVALAPASPNAYIPRGGYAVPVVNPNLNAYYGGGTTTITTTTIIDDGWEAAAAVAADAMVATAHEESAAAMDWKDDGPVNEERGMPSFDDDSWDDGDDWSDVGSDDSSDDDDKN